jgi:hypothetical protein
MRALCCGLIALAAAVSHAAAEPPTGSRLGERTISGIKYTEDQADEVATKLARCMIAKRNAPARAYLDAFSSEDADKAQIALFREIECMWWVGLSDMSDTTRASIPRDVLRGKLAEVSLTGERSKVERLPPLPLGKEYWRPWFAATGRDPMIDEMAACVADTNPRGITALIGTRSYSKEETATFAAIVPSLGTCLRVGGKLQANRHALRAALADALYQRLMRPSPAEQAAQADAAARKARLIFWNFAQCVAKKKADDARSYILDDLNNRQTTAFRTKMLDDACWRIASGERSPIVTTGLRLQGTLAEALMVAESELVPLKDIEAIAPLKHDPVSQEAARKAEPETLKFLQDMAQLFEAGECVVRKDGAGSYALLKSGPASPEEVAALAALKPAFQGCVQQDLRWTSTTADLRATVAVNYYRLAHAARTVASTGVQR